MDHIRKIREEIKELADVLRSKDEKYRELLETFNKLPKDVTRASYTTRILEIVKNVKKQKADIDKVKKKIYFLVVLKKLLS